MPSRRSHFVLVAFLASVTALGASATFACGSDDEDASPPIAIDASRDGDGGAPGTIDLDSGGRTCALSSDLEALEACAPDAALEGVALAAEVREACGGCLGGAKRCTVAVDPDAKTIRLALDGEICVGGDGTCDRSCRQGAFRCDVPALGAGHYRLLYGQGGAKEIEFDVSDSGTGTACATPALP